MPLDAASNDPLGAPILGMEAGDEIAEVLAQIRVLLSVATGGPPLERRSASLNRHECKPGKLTGEQEDGAAGDSGYYFLRARYYDAGLGRFVSRDPLEFDSRLAR